MLPFKMNLNAPNIVNICIDRREGEAAYAGRMYCRYKKDEILFQNECHLLKIMDTFMDQIGFPQASVKMRSYRKKEESPEKIPVTVSDGEEIFRQRGILATFFIYVQYRQHATWQGEAAWVEKGQIRKFRSDLELLRLLDEAC